MESIWVWIFTATAGVVGLLATWLKWISYAAIKDLTKPHTDRVQKWFVKQLEPKPAKDWVQRINKAFDGKFSILVPGPKLPDIKCDTEVDYIPTPEQKKAVKLIKQQFERDNKKRSTDLKIVDEPHAIVRDGTNWNADHFTVKYQILNYSMIKAIRESGKKPQIVSGNGLIICKENRHILLHRRSKSSATYPCMLHIIGGSHIPKETELVRADWDGLANTVMREVQEEAGIKLDEDNYERTFVSREETTGFIQFNFLGWNVPPAKADRLTARPEGHPEWWSFDKLEDALASDDWVPSGKAIVLTWLALGAPGTRMREKFGSHSAKELFDKIIPQ